jgi:hypothetical protein
VDSCIMKEVFCAVAGSDSPSIQTALAAPAEIGLTEAELSPAFASH